MTKEETETQEETKPEPQDDATRSMMKVLPALMKNPQAMAEALIPQILEGLEGLHVKLTIEARIKNGNLLIKIPIAEVEVK